MRNLTLVNQAITTEFLAIQQRTELSDEIKYASLENECDYLLARGQALIWLPTVATTLIGTLINKIADVTPEQLITVFPEGTGARKQGLNNSIKMVALHGLLISGHTDVKTIHTALDNWIDQDNVILEDETCALLTEQLAEQLVIEFINADIIDAEQGQARTEDGAFYNSHGLTDDINALRTRTIRKMWKNAKPRMQPMRHALLWNIDGTCQLNNLNMINGKSRPAPEFVHSMNYMGNTGYTVNAAIREELELWLERDECPELPEDEAEALKVMNKYNDKVRTVEELLELPTGVTLYFPHTADWRGRAYARGGLTQFQSIKECRAILDFAEYSVIDTTDAKKGLYLHVANAFGRDKLSINSRMNWVEENKTDILNGDFDCGIYSVRARLALDESIQTGKTNIICHIDGTCNGSQWVSAMYRDEKTAQLVNVCKADLDDVPHDLYGVIAETAAKLATGKERDALIKFNRDLAKQPIMVLSYGAGEETLKQACKDFLSANNHPANGDKVYKAIMTAISLKAPSLTRLTKNLKRILKSAPRNTLTWHTPDLQVVAEITNTEHLNLYGSSYTAKLEEFVQSEEDSKKRYNAECEALARGISPNYVHSMDSAHLRAVNRIERGGLSCIHDSIGAPAHRLLAVNKTVREEFHRINQMDLVSNIYFALEHKYTQQRGTLNIDEVLQASYIFS